MTPLALPLLLALATPAQAGAVEAELGGNLKLFHTSTYPYDDDRFAAEVADGSAFLRTDYPLDEDTIRAQSTSQGLLTSRLVGTLYAGDFTFELHPQLTMQPGTAAGAGLALNQTGVGLPEAVDLSWDAVEDDGLNLQLRADRLSATYEKGPVRATVGRQAITFGHGMFFTPMDLVNPFFPTAVDQEYKPGVDAARVDAYWGMAGQVTLASAYQGDWDLAGMVHAAYVQSTFGVWDVGLFGGAVHGDLVGGVSTAGSAGPVSLHADVTVTGPGALLDEADRIDPDEELFVRAVAGASGNVTAKTSLAGEIYHQSNGGEKPGQYLDMYTSERFSRGELWLAGRTYAGLSVSQEIVPTINAGLFAIVNLEDPSALVGPNLAWSVSDNVSAGLGGYIGLGERADPYQVEEYDNGLEALVGAADAMDGFVRSEFGLVPVVAFANMQAYF